MIRISITTLLIVFMTVFTFFGCKDVDETTPQTWETNQNAVDDKEKIDAAADAAAAEIAAEAAKEVTTIDESTDLMWQDDGNAAPRKWQDAIDYCDALTVVDYYSDWRLPTKDELGGIYDRRTILKSYNTSIHWSSTPREGTTDRAWCLHFFGGTWISNTGVYTDYKSNNHYVRCVRGGQ